MKLLDITLLHYFITLGLNKIMISARNIVGNWCNIMGTAYGYEGASNEHDHCRSKKTAEEGVAPLGLQNRFWTDSVPLLQ